MEPKACGANSPLTVKSLLVLSISLFLIILSLCLIVYFLPAIRTMPPIGADLLPAPPYAPADACHTITGEGTYTLTQSITATGTCIQIQSDNVTLDCNGFSIIGSQTGNGINATGRNNISITNCMVTNFTYAVNFTRTNSSFIVNSSFYNNTWGVTLNYSINNTLVNDSFYNNSQNGIYIYGSSNNTFTNNSVSNNANPGFVIDHSSYNVILNCSFYNNSYGIYFVYLNNYNNITNNTISFNRVDGIGGCAACGGEGSYTIFDSNTIYNNSEDGINLYRSLSANITNNSIYNNTRHGIFLSTSSLTLIVNNSILDNGQYGIGNDYSSYQGYNGGNNISWNTLQGNRYYDLWLDHLNGPADVYDNNTGTGGGEIRVIRTATTLGSGNFSELILYSTNNSVMENLTLHSSDTLHNNGLIAYTVYYSNFTNITASGTRNGIYLQYGGNNTLVNNTLHNNTNGIYLSQSNNNTLTNNTAYYNTNGIYTCDISMINPSYYLAITNNTAYNNSVGIYPCISNSLVANNTAYFNTYGIYTRSSYSTIADNYLYNNSQYGIRLFKCY
ncbi:Periplasmic copper-binding protein (NosD) [Candidatus Gugararchaeum adminiculabundum]|nr:Periplasmic copper-binding protein (NosD) [Candidatus Gugararchaeum adminiculabundum]